MTSHAEHPPLNLLQRLDLALANRIATEAPPLPEDLLVGKGLPRMPIAPVDEWVSGILGLRGLQVTPEEVEGILAGESSRFAPSHHEYLLVEGMTRVYRRLVAGEFDGPPDGWQMVELFKEFSAGVARFRNNCLRKDMPWDAILYVDYPAADILHGCLDGFHLPNHFTDLRTKFESVHPVRQAFRVMWLFARIAPFPDFNLAMSWVAMNLYLRHSGYPMLAPERADRERLHRLVSGPIPQKVIPYEARLLDDLQGS